MTQAKDEEREDRITMEIVVDAYSSEEQAMGWYYYLQDKITFPFEARCIAERKTSPLLQGEVIAVTALAPEDNCLHEMFVMADWEGRSFGLPLSQVEAVETDEETRQAIDDWHYWVEQGHSFT